MQQHNVTIYVIYYKNLCMHCNTVKSKRRNESEFPQFGQSYWCKNGTLVRKENIALKTKSLEVSRIPIVDHSWYASTMEKNHLLFGRFLPVS